MSQPLVLAIEPDLRQAAIVKRIVREKALADVAVVDSRDAAIEAMRTCMPDVLLLSALMSPRDEDELIAHLKTLENAGHLQTHTIPQLASALQPGDERGGRGLLSAFRRKKDPGPANGCDPDLFADEIRVFLKRAAEKKLQLQDSNHAAPDMRPSPAGRVRAAAPENAAAAPQDSSWSSPFEWKPGASSSRNIPSYEPEAAHPSSPIAHPESLIPDPASLVADPVALVADANPSSPIADPEPLIPHPVSLIPDPVSFVAGPVSPVRDSEPTISAAPVPATAESPREAAGSWRKDSGFTVKDSGFRIKDSGSAIRDEGLVALGFAPLGVWVRGDRNATEPADGPEDVRGLLSTLAVPSAIAAVSYPRGCRIRRVRVPAIPEADSAEAPGVVVASRGTAGEHRDRRPSA